MFQRAAVALTAVALIGIVSTIYAVIGSTPFFPKSLQSEEGECPATEHHPAYRGPIMDQWSADWFSSELVAFSEKPIFQDKNRDQQVVRFLLQRSFDANVMVQTVETPTGDIRLTAKWQPGPDGCDSTKTQCIIDRVLTAVETRRLKAAQAVMLRKASYGCLSGIDGSMWIVEASGHGTYRFWNEWAPRNGDLRGLAIVMLELTGWRFQNIY
jgi:hypothetical protein